MVFASNQAPKSHVPIQESSIGRSNIKNRPYLNLPRLQTPLYSDLHPLSYLFGLQPEHQLEPTLARFLHLLARHTLIVIKLLQKI